MDGRKNLRRLPLYHCSLIQRDCRLSEIERCLASAFTRLRGSEACSLHTADVYGADGRVCDRITFRRATTKGKQETRSVPVSPELRQLLEGYRSDPGRISFAARPYLFPGRWGRGHICPASADAILRAAFKRLGIEGASTHSFRRTAITWMHDERVPIKHIQSISGHKSLSALQRYIDVTEKDKEMAIATLRRFLEKNVPSKLLVPMLRLGMPWLKLCFLTGGGASRLA